MQEENDTPSPDHDAIVYGEAVIGQTGDVPLPNLHLVTQHGNEGELIGTRYTTLLTLLHPVVHLVLCRKKL